MFLKSIEIFGFKSFADKSKIEFGDGLSAIIGPNGCGKSNVVEAIRWVLGEQSSKGLRLEKMANVIFNGTEQRHPLNVAEVTLIFSNEDNILPLDFAEVSIKRRIFRSSNSEYYINNNLVTLRELRELMADTGIGVTEYIVMEQGRLDHILESKPQERRSILEEAAGIKKFRMRSMEGTRRREKVKENIVQIEQILLEVEKQYNTLKVQSERAKEYRVLSDIVFVCEVALECKKYGDYKDQHLGLKAQCSKEESKLTDLENQQKKVEEDNQEYQNEIKQREAKSIELHKRSSVILTEKEGIKQIIRTNISHMEDMKNRVASDKIQLKAQEARKKEQEKESKGFEQEKKAQAHSFTQINTDILSAQKKIDANRKSIAEYQQTKVKLAEREQYIDLTLEEHQQELRAVVDRLAEELDKRISQTGYSANLQNKLEAKAIHSQEKLKQEIIAFQKMLKEKSTSNDTNKAQIDVADMKTRIEDILAINAQVREDFKNYRESIPSFLNDFLENDGVLSRKHLIDEKINALLKERLESKHTTLEINKKIEKVEDENRKTRERIHDMELKKNSYTQKIESIKRDELRIKRSLDDICAQIKVQEANINSQEQALKKWKEEQSEHENKFKKLEQDDKKINSELELIKKEIQSQYSASGVHAKKMDALKQKILVSTRQLQSQKDKITDIEARIYMISDNFRDRHGDMIENYLDHNDFKKKIKEGNQKIKEDLAESKQRISQLGSVNLLAADEYERVEERYNHLTSQLKDLQVADKNLQEVMQKIEGESRIKMEETFKEVQKHFSTIFKRMMGGGYANLELVDSEDILEAGLEIYAQPPQKKTHYLSQLSGGERTLIALSLLFAVHSVRPAPFCLLDELDAPLDDKNIDKFLELLHSFKHLTQFVVVSHNKRTIAQSQNIIGVTMEEYGISKFIGVKINEEAS